MSLTVDQVAASLGVHASRVKALIAQGRIAASKELRTVGHQTSRWGKPLRIRHWISLIEEDALSRYRDSLRLQRIAKQPAPYEFLSLDQMTKERCVGIGWLAGIIDGEGHIGIHQKVTRGKSRDWYGYTPVVVVAMHSQSVCDCALAISGVGKVKLLSPAGKRYRFDHWHWRCRSADAVSVLQSVRPFLVEKAEQADLVLEAARLNGRYNAERDGRARPPEFTERLREIANRLFALHGNAHKHL
jgi:hypothetical protein